MPTRKDNNETTFIRNSYLQLKILYIQNLNNSTDIILKERVKKITPFWVTNFQFTNLYVRVSNLYCIEQILNK